MVTPQRPPHIDSPAYTQRNSRFVNRDFQLNYTRKTVLISLIGTVVFMAPVIYWTNQNYSFFSEMAYSIQPGLIDHIEAEQNTLNTLFFVSLIGQLIFLALVGQKMTDKIVAPLKLLQNHMRYLTRGQFTVEEMKVRTSDEFHDLITTYNYCYLTLKNQIESDLERLEEARTHTSHPISREILKAMIIEKKAQLNWPIATSLESEKSHDSRHVS